MKTPRILTRSTTFSAFTVGLFALSLANLTPNACAQQPSAVDPVEDEQIYFLDSEELDDLLGPIALYPDALIALILPAATVPLDVTFAARFLQNGDLDQVDEQPWDESVIGLTRYPDVLVWLDDNLEWTSAVGEAFYNQPVDVMNSVQRLRERARDTGALMNTPEQIVLVEEEVIRIVPADPEVIYVPIYEPEVVYVERDRTDTVATALISFGAGFVAGSWLSYDFDWQDQQFYQGEEYGWNDRDRWIYRGQQAPERNVNFVENNTTITNVTTINHREERRWEPSERSRRQIVERQQKTGGNARFVRATEPADTTDENPTTDATAVAAAAPVPTPAKIRTDENRQAAPPREADKAKRKADREERRQTRSNAPAQAASEPQDQATPQPAPSPAGEPIPPASPLKKPEATPTPAAQPSSTATPEVTATPAAAATSEPPATPESSATQEPKAGPSDAETN
ncbi:MAG: DUF3300 domain-containing protein, partial [Chthoniobacterales bacterium]